MFRYLFVIGNLRLPAYGTMMVVAYFTAVYFASTEAKRRKLDPTIIQSLSIWIIVGLIIGARIWYVAEYWEYYSVNVIEIFKLWAGGMVFYGGFIGGFITGIIYIASRRLPIWDLLDILAPGIAFGIGIGRIGCFLNGCCFGKITDSFIGIKFPQRFFPPVYWSHLKRGLIASDAAYSLPVIPTQILSTVNLFIIFAILWSIRKKSPFRGFLFSLFLGFYGLHRFIIDFFRYYEGSAVAFKFLTLSQITSIFMILVSVILIIWGYIRRKGEGVRVLNHLLKK